MDQGFFEANDLAMKANEKQAMFPEHATVLANTLGTAPGCIFHHGKQDVLVLPVLPDEMERMFLQKRFLI